MGNLKNRVKRNKRLSNNWRNNIKMRKNKRVSAFKTESNVPGHEFRNISTETSQDEAAQSPYSVQMNDVSYDMEIDVPAETDDDHANDEGQFEEHNTHSSINSKFKHNTAVSVEERNFDDGEFLIGCGMINLGNACFFNAVFQAFFHIPVVNLTLQEMELSNCECIGCEIIKAFKDSRSISQSKKTYSPIKFYQAIKKDNRDMFNGKQQDTHEFWLRIMKSMETNCCKRLYELFEHDISSAVVCQNCNKNSQICHQISEHIINFRGHSSIQTAWDDNFAETLVDDYWCNVCFTSTTAAKRYYLTSFPKCLHLVLNRFENDRKIGDDIGLNKQLKVLTNGKDLKQETRYYKLVSIVNHIGTSRFRGHYTTFSIHNEHCLEFDDIEVRNMHTVVGFNAYMLTYQLSTEATVDNNAVINETFTNSGCNNEKDVEQEQLTSENEPIHTDVPYFEEIIGTNDTRQYSETEINTNNFDQESNGLTGRRIVDIQYLLEQMKYLTKHSDQCDSEMVFTKETKLGFRSIFHFQCSECGIFHKLKSDVNDGVTISVNKAATLGFTSIGSAFYHMEEVCAHLNIPCMSSNTFNTENKKLQKDWWAVARDQTELAMKEEIEYAKATGSVDSAGNALIVVTADGSWGKRSYGKGYSSLSGCAAIIGVHTKKVIYYGVKNKYCHTCALSYSKMCPPNYHECNINYSGPSSGMETEIIVEGFQYCDGRGLRFSKIISDGDSSAFKEISERCVYQFPDVIVEKVECVNHLFKNARKKFLALCSSTTFDTKYRKLVKPSLGDDICKGISCAADHWRGVDLSLSEKLENLERDCLNAPYHYLGNHDNCGRYFCKRATDAQSITNIDLLKSSGLFYEIVNVCNVYFASNVRSLIADTSNNAAEELNNLIAKYLGGKRINYSLAGSYGGRVSAAVVQYNTKGHAGSHFHNLHSVNTASSCLKMENVRIRHNLRNEVARQEKPRVRIAKDKETKGYGEPQCPDLTGSAFETAKKNVLDKLNTDRMNREVILANTYSQRHNDEWRNARKKLINCTYFGRIVHCRTPKTYKTLLYEMLYSPKDNTADNRHRRAYEEEALKMFSLLYKEHELEKTGLFIDKDYGYLGASPIRLYGNESIVNVQCPVKVFQKTFQEALSKKFKKWIPYLKEQDRDIQINPKSQWYVEAQGQLHITGRSTLFLVVWLGKEFIVRKVLVDHEFWENNMKKKLEFFFNEAMLKELADPRRKRKMELRDYDRKNNTFI